MTLTFIESKPQKKPNVPQNFWKLIFAGLFLINGVCLCFIPIGISFSYHISAFLLVILFLPIVLFGIYLSHRLGMGILLAGFLSIPSGAIGFLILGDYVGVLTKFTYVETATPKEVLLQNNGRVFGIQNFRIPKEFLGTISKLHSASGLQTYLYPVFDLEAKKDSPVSVWGVCKEKSFEVCQTFQKGMVLLQQDSESVLIQIKTLENRFQLKSAKGFVVLKFSKDPIQKIKEAGMFGSLFLLLINVSWILSVLLFFRFVQN